MEESAAKGPGFPVTKWEFVRQGDHLAGVLVLVSALERLTLRVEVTARGPASMVKILGSALAVWGREKRRRFVVGEFDWFTMISDADADEEGVLRALVAVRMEEDSGRGWGRNEWLRRRVIAKWEVRDLLLAGLQELPVREDEGPFQMMRGGGAE